VNRNGGGLELGVGRVEAQRGKIESGTRCSGVFGARGSFYKAGGWEGRRCGEGNGRWQRCAFKAFNPSVMGGERRGEWGVKGEGKCGAVSRRGGVIGAAGARGEGGGSGA
jgi:hypothetical protein